MYHYAIGLDIGITSVGWAAVALDESEQPCGILGMGSRIFDSAEQPKTGMSLAAPRREARGARRRLRRRHHRAERIRRLLVNSGVVTGQQLEALFAGQLEDIYALRVRALDAPVSSEELVRILLHIAKRRGFRSNRRNAADKEEGKLLAAIGENRRRMEENGYRTVGEMFYKDPLFSEHKRNRGGNYLATVTRDMVEDEVHKLFAAQRAFGCSSASEELEAAYLSILLSQRSFDEGPGGNSPYGGNQIEKMVGRCTFEPGKPRAAKAAYSFEYFRLLEQINHIRLIHRGESLPLSSAQRETIIALAHKSDSLDYAKLRKALALDEGYTFNTVRYDHSKSVEECEKKEKFKHMRAYHEMRRALDKVSKGRIAMLSLKERNELATVLTLYKTEANIRAQLEQRGFDPHDIDAALNIGSFSGFGHISVEACDKLIPYLEQGMNYNEACEAAGYDFKAHVSGEKTFKLKPEPEDFEDITSPVVRRAVSQTIKVINAIIDERGTSPVFINIELAREMSKDFSERIKLDKSNQENRAKNERIIERLRTEFGVTDPGGQDIVKFKLFEEQGGVCAYSLRQMSLEHLFEPNYAEIDHIAPYSISFDDSYTNKVLVLTEENRNKGNRLPLEYLTGERRDKFIVWTNNNVRNYKKRQLLLKEGFTDEDRKAFKERNLQDTKYISRFLLNYINDHLAFAPSVRGRKKRVTAVNGSVTSYMRKRWGITKLREDGDLHHAVDALVIACTTDGMIQQISRYAQLRECRYQQCGGESIAIDDKTGEVLRRCPYPWPDFRRELEARLAADPQRVIRDYKLPFYLDGDLIGAVKPLFVSRMPQRKVTGAAHKDTIRSAKALNEGLTVSKRPLTDLKFDKNGELLGYYKPESDRLLYEALKARLALFDGNAKKAFAEPFHKPKSDGTPGPVVSKVKLCEKSTLNVPVHNGSAVADHDSMVRIDVFQVEGDGYYFVPIYIADTLKPELPIKACVGAKPYSSWKDMCEEDFIFSLYPNDLVRISWKSTVSLSKVFKESSLPDKFDTDSELLYYKCADISTASITCINHDNTYFKRGLGLKMLLSMEKYTVDVLGNYHKVNRETRQPFHMKRG